MPAASNSRKRCARVVAAGEDVVAAGAGDADGDTVLSAGSGSNVVRGPFGADAADAVLAVIDDGAADSEAVVPLYDRTRTINAVANATVRSVRKTDRNEIWTRRRMRDPSVDNARNSESERLDFRAERFAIRQLHRVAALHRSHRRPQRAEAGVFETLPGREHRRLADHARSLHPLHIAIRVSDDPFAADELHRLSSVIRNYDVIGKEKVAFLRIAPLLDIRALDLNADSSGGGVGHLRTRLVTLSFRVPTRCSSPSSSSPPRSRPPHRPPPSCRRSSSPSAPRWRRCSRNWKQRCRNIWRNSTPTSSIRGSSSG